MRIGPLKLVFVSSPDHIADIFRTTGVTGSRQFILFAIQYMFSCLKDVIKSAYARDNWVSVFPTIFHGKDDLLNKSLLALYTGFIGRKCDDASLTGLGMELYADALRLLRWSDILTSNKRQSDVEVKLASIMVLSRCELLTAEGGNGGYMAHVRGGMELVKRFATRLPCNELSKMIIKKFRLMGASVVPYKHYFGLLY